MTDLQNPSVPPPIQAIEIDKAIFDIQLLLETKLSWLSHNYGRCYKFKEQRTQKLYFPQIYIGDNNYFTVTPDNDKKGMCFFVVGKERIRNFQQYEQNFITWEVGIIFNVNLELINNPLSKNELFTQNLISDVRKVLTNSGLNIEIKEVVRDFRDIYREFSLSEDEQYLRAPLQGFRFNCEITLLEDCFTQFIDVCAAIKQNLSIAEKKCLFEDIDFSNPYNLIYLTEQQKEDLKNIL